ncbi:hypothetical protein ABLE93_19105 [Xanthobacter sp. KR7-65]|uniref:hypothetical protein n=1 Tax=Xanthobacter sp. KR7-65 TaxID=3156612 RepID=UPI0032B52686
MNRFHKAGPEFLIERHTRGVQMHPQLAAVQGGFVAVWTDDMMPACEIGGSDVRAKLFSLSGNPVRGEFLVNRETIACQRDPKLAIFPNGGFVVVWQDFSGRGGDDCCGGIKAKLFGADGRVVHEELTVNVETYGTQFNATVAALADGAFVVVWQGNKGVGKDAVRGGVRARLFKPSGAPAGDEFLLSACPEGRQDSPLVAGLADGNFVVVWTDLNVTSDHGKESVIKAKLFAPNGAMVRDEFLVGPPTAKSQAATAVAGLCDGGFVIAWIDRVTTHKRESEASIKVRVFDSKGEPSGDEYSTAAGTLNDQQGPVLAPLLDGGFVMVWSGSIALGDHAGTSAVRALVFEPSGALVGTDFLVSAAPLASQSNPTVAGLPDGSFAVSWEHAADANGAVSVRARIFNPTASSASMRACPPSPEARTAG